MDTIELADNIIEAIYKKVHYETMEEATMAENKTLTIIAEICLKEVISKNDSEFRYSRIKKKEWKSAIPKLIELLKD